MNMAEKASGKYVGDGYRGERSKKNLQCSTMLTARWKEDFKNVRERAARGEKVFWINPGIPVELFSAMEIPVMFNLQYSALCSAKQMANHYLDILNHKMGYFRDLCRYCSLPLGYFYERNDEIAPWGGVPKISAFVAEVADNPFHKIWQLEALQNNAPLYLIEKTMPTQPPTEYWEDFEYETKKEPWRLDHMVRELEGLIRFVETISGKQYSESKLIEALERSNLQYEYISQTLELTKTVPCPISITDHISNLIATQFYRGTEFGVSHAKRMYEEVKERAEKKQAACENEKVRLMCMGIPPWFSPGFFNAFEEKYGAVFIWMIYLHFIITHRRKDLRDPLRALASRYMNYSEMVNLPPWSDLWLLWNAKKYKIDGVVYLMAESCKIANGTVRLSRKRLEDAGIPTLEVAADMVDVRDWDDTKMKALISSFIETLL